MTYINRIKNDSCVVTVMIMIQQDSQELIIKHTSTWNVKNQNGGSNFSKNLKVYNPFFSTGELYENNGGIQVYQKQFTIKRPPFSDEIRFHAAGYRGGHRYIDLSSDNRAIAALDGIGIGHLL